MKKIIKIVIVLVLIMITVALGMYLYKLMRDNAYAKITINGQEIILTKDTQAEIHFDLETLNSEQDTMLKIERRNCKVKINDKIVKGTEEISLGKININKENNIQVEIKLLGENKWKEYIINTLPVQFPEYEFENKNGMDKEEYYLTTYRLMRHAEQHYIYKLNQLGEVVFYKKVPKVCYNFKKNQVEEGIRYTYLQSYGDLGEGFTLSLPTKLIVLDEKYNQINEISYFLQEEGEEIDRKLDNHDYLYLSDNHYILSNFDKQIIKDFPGEEGTEIKVWNCRIQEVLDGKILWEFESIKNKELYNYWLKDNHKVTKYGTLDYMHLNSIQIDPEDGNIVCSFRNIDAIIKLDRKTGEIIWVLGGNGDEFGLTETQKFSKQHSISFLSDHSILIYDNGCANQKTRVLKIKIDEKKKKVEEFTSYDLNVYAQMMGAVQEIDEQNNIYLVTYGIGNHAYGFQKLNLETLEPITSFKLKGDNSMYCVNKYD